MEERKKILILTTVMEPYRIRLFDEIAKAYDVYVMFEQKKTVPGMIRGI